MPTDVAELVISCRADGTQNINKFTDAVRQADGASNQLVKTLGGLFSTAAILQFSKVSIAAYSDLQEATQKFYEVFKGLEQEAGKEAKILEERFGASERSAKSMLSLTGDLLTGFGFSREEALKLSAQVAQLGSDIASFSNYAGGAEGATQAITKAMLGETEMAKMLGIAIKTDSQEYKELYKRIKETRGTTDSQTKALAALQIAFQQKGNAMGDFERNITSIANRGRILENQLETLRANIGKVFAQDYSEGQQLFIDLLKSFNNLEEPQRNFIVKTGAIAAALMAAKTAAGAYSFFSGMAAKTATENAVAVTKEAAAHTANAAAIVAENAARGVGAGVADPYSAARALKQNRNDIVAAKHAVQMAKYNKLDAKEVAALNAKYRELLVTRRQLYQDAGMENAARQMGAFNQTVAGVNRQIAVTNKSLVATGSAAVLGKVKTGMLAVAGATRTATVAALGLAKAFLPMLAISGAIAGIDYLVNRSKRAAEARNEYAESLVAGAQKAIEAEQKQAVADNDMIARLKEMSKYSRLTTDEQEKAAQMIQQLSRRYSGLADQIKIVNGLLVIGKDAWNGITEAQRQNHLQGLQKKLVAQKQSTIDQMSGFQAVFDNMSNVAELAKDSFGGFSKYTLQDKIKEAFSFDDAAIKKAILEDALSLATKHGYSDHKEYLKSIIESLEKELQLEKEIVEIRKYAAGGGGGVKTGDTEKQRKEYNKALKKLKTTWRDATIAGMKDPEKLAYLDKRYDEINQKYQAAMERSKGDLEMQTKTVQYAKELIDLEKERAEIKRKTAEDEMNFYNQLLQNATRLRTTAQNGIDANSVEAIQMQSRRMGSGAGLQAAAKMTAEATKQAAEAAKKANDILDDIRKRQSEIYDSLAKLEVSSL